MIPSKILAVLLSLIVVAACNRAGEDAVPFYSERSYRVDQISTISSDGSVFVELAEDFDNNGSKSGKNFWVHIRRISVGIDPDSNSTYIRVRGARGVSGEPDLSRVYEAMIVVRKEEQKEKWDEFLTKKKDELYGPRDVFPPNFPTR